ncbi:glycosyltransferase family 2 protein [Patescibacteria group bacterium]|nr:glycosyltransferase family 2 protein [Patescibacteria group bacterium]
MAKISVVINTLNEERNLFCLLASIKEFAEDIVVVDMNSDDSTADIAEKAGARVYTHKRTGYVEPARNFAISKALGDWILILDADEVLTKTLAKKLTQIAKNPTADYYRLPRKNIIFGTWIKHSKWWPDYNIRFFKKGKVSWSEVIHSVPMTQGRGADLPAKEDYAILHYNYATVDDYLVRMNRYTTIQSQVLIDSGYKFIWKDLISKPATEFIGRYLAGEGYKDGVHGLSLAFLQAFSELVLYLKIWQAEKFLPQSVTFPEARRELEKTKKEFDWWMYETEIKNQGPLASLSTKVIRKVFLKR